MPAVDSFAASTPTSPAALLAELSSLASNEALAGAVARRFAPLLLDILARWLDAPASEERLAVLASLAEPRPDLWP